MLEFLAGVGVMFVIEGIMFAGFPARVREAMAAIITAPETVLRVMGLASALIGLVMIWLVRG